MTLTPPVRVAVLAAVLVLTGLGAVVFLLGRAQDPATSSLAPITKPVAHAGAKPIAAPSKPAATRTKPVFAPDLPRPVAKAFLNRKVVVIAVYVPGAPVDRAVRAEARAGARMSVAGFVPVSVTSENALEKIVAKAGVIPAPAVVIMRRPGVVVTTLGVADRQTVAAAVAQAKAGR